MGLHLLISYVSIYKVNAHVLKLGGKIIDKSQKYIKGGPENYLKKCFLYIYISIFAVRYIYF